MVRYYKLFDLLNRKGMKKSDLRGVISSATVAKLSKGEYISLEAVDKICRFLDCQIGDIVEIVESDEERIRREKGEIMLESMAEKLFLLYQKQSELSHTSIQEVWSKERDKHDYETRTYIDSRIENL